MKIPLKVNKKRILFLFIHFDYFLIEEPQPDLTNCVLFHGVTYLGSASTTAPRSEEELHK